MVVFLHSVVVRRLSHFFFKDSMVECQYRSKLQKKLFHRLARHFSVLYRLLLPSAITTIWDETCKFMYIRNQFRVGVGWLQKTFGLQLNSTTNSTAKFSKQNRFEIITMTLRYHHFVFIILFVIEIIWPLWQFAFSPNESYILFHNKNFSDKMNKPHFFRLYASKIHYVITHS